MANFRKDDPLYYKEALKKLTQQAEENGLQVYAEEKRESVIVYFKDKNSEECAGVILQKRSKNNDYQITTR